MERLNEHEQLQELLGAYALDAVEPEEAAALERHLAMCPRCRAELAEHREVAGLLGYAGATAPEGVWNRIVASLEEPPPALRLARIPIDVAPPRRDEAGLDQPRLDEQWTAPPQFRSVDRPPPRTTGKFVSMGRSGGGRDRGRAGGSGGAGGAGRSGGRKGQPRLIVAALAVAALFAAALGIGLTQLHPKSSPTTVVALQQRLWNAAQHAPGARPITLKAVDGIHSVPAVVLPDGKSYLGPGDLPSLTTDKTYQLWGQVGADRVSLGVVGSSPNYAEFTTPPEVRVLALTIEDPGGVVASTKSPVATALLPA
jgi:anti-sigma factor RsiW